VQSVVTNTASSVLASVVTVLSTVIAMVALSWQLTLLSLGIVPVFVYLTWRVGRVRRRISTSTQESLAELSAMTEETLSVSGVLLAKVFDRQRDAVDRYREENRRLAALQVRQQMVGRSLFALVQTFFSVAPALIYLVAGQSHLSSGTIVAFTTLQTRLLFPIGSLLQTSVEVQSSLALFERIFQYLDLPHDIVDTDEARRLEVGAVRGSVAFRDVFFRYDELEVELDGNGAAPPPPAREWTLDDVNLEVEPGQLAALVGPSGAGKTTISYLVPRLYDVTRGRVEIDNLDVREIRLASLAEIVGMVTQETYLFHATVRENLLYARPDATQEEVEAAARAAAIHQRIVELEDGYDTLVGERGYRMSGGEKQRLAIARVILKDPRILILDEATSALDTTSERLVQSALEPLMKDRTTIAIAHRLSTILAADVIFVLDRGRIVERGTHQELVAAGGLYADLYRQQFGGGVLEARCEDGVVLTSGQVLSTADVA
jgi:ATP-binding cassette subfamily B protein